MFVLQLEATATAICVTHPDNSDVGFGEHDDTLTDGRKNSRTGKLRRKIKWELKVFINRTFF
jgi:hypothetical protein